MRCENVPVQFPGSRQVAPVSRYGGTIIDYRKSMCYSTMICTSSFWVERHPGLFTWLQLGATRGPVPASRCWNRYMNEYQWHEPALTMPIITAPVAPPRSRPFAA